MTKGAVANYENDVSVPKIELLCELMNALEVDPNYMYQDEMNLLKNVSCTDLIYDKLLDWYNKLNKDGKEKLLTYAGDLVQSGRYKQTKGKPLPATDMEAAQ